MNERIRELAYEAEDYADTMVDGGSEFHPTFVKKFAELIVRECIQVVDDMADPEEDSDRYFWVIQNASEKIKEHFGVE
jgi:hypothetical protein